MKPWYQIRAAEQDDAELLIYDEIGRNWFGEGISAEALVKELSGIEASTLNVRINSVGGQVFEGLAIYNALERHPAKVVAHIDGIAASIASIVALAADEVRIAENAFMMVHNPWGMVIGNANEMMEMAATLEKLGGSLAQTYMKRTGKDEATVRGWMDEETWFSAKDALEVGLVDQVTEKRDVKAAVDLSRFSKVPTDLAARLKEPPAPAGPAPELVQLTAASVRTLSRTVL